jgi:hypothetical protein
MEKDSDKFPYNVLVEAAAYKEALERLKVKYPTATLHYNQNLEVVDL